MAVEKSTVPVYTSQLGWLQITTLANQGSFQAQVAKITENPLGYEDQNGEAADDLTTKPA
jgi:hypothetical protein